MSKKAIILFSGGLDSTTCLAIAKSQGFSCYLLSFAYGQKHSAEIEHAKIIAQHYAVAQHKILTLPLDQIGGSSLTDKNLDVESYDEVSKAIPNTYVPARNTIFLSFALAWGEVIEAQDLFIGANCIDYSNYPDCRPEYLSAFETMANLATTAGLENNKKFVIHSPLLTMNKAQIIQTGHSLGVDYSLTVSCYRADALGRACGSCQSCTFRKKGFLQAGIKDTTKYL